MRNLITYSGFLAAFFAWLFIVLPSLLVKFDKKKFPISFVGTLRKVKYLFNFGLIASGVSQIFFIFWLLSKFNNILIGSLIFFIGSLSVIMTGIITLKKSPQIHTFFAFSYFAFTAVGGLVISLQLHVWFVILFVSLELISMSYFYFFKKHHSLCEYSGILFSTFWVLSFYLIK